jgi:hypothetical protein
MNQVIGYSAVGSDSYGLVFAIVAALILISAWVILAASRLVQGGVVERPERVPQLYGYAVCLIALIWALASSVSIIQNALSLSAPELRGSNDYGWEPSITSFEAFRATYDRARRMGMDPRETRIDSVSEPELQRRYQALRADRIQRSRFEARRELITSGLSLVIAILLFVFHWRWMRRGLAASN